MGWNSWNRFHCDVNEKVVRDAADAMVASGMKDAGHLYVVVDDCWQGERDAAGRIVPDQERFPSGMQALADYVHSKGLRFGLYSDAGEFTCATRPGSKGHEATDAKSYAEWGVDYLKYDWCHTEGQDARDSYGLMSRALRATDRPIVFPPRNQLSPRRRATTRRLPIRASSTRVSSHVTGTRRRNSISPRRARTSRRRVTPGRGRRLMAKLPVVSGSNA